MAVEIQQVIDRMDRRTDVAKKIAAVVLTSLFAAIVFLGWQLDTANEQVNHVRDVQVLQQDAAARSDCARAVAAEYTQARDEVSIHGWRGLKALGLGDDEAFNQEVRLVEVALRELDALPPFDQEVERRC